MVSLRFETIKKARWQTMNRYRIYGIFKKKNYIFSSGADTVELQWLEHLWDQENELETGVVRANEGWL